MATDLRARMEPELRIMDAYPGEHYPVEREIEYGEMIGGVPILEGSRRHLFCGCTDALQHDYGHAAR